MGFKEIILPRVPSQKESQIQCLNLSDYDIKCKRNYIQVVVGLSLLSLTMF